MTSVRRQTGPWYPPRTNEGRTRGAGKATQAVAERKRQAMSTVNAWFASHKISAHVTMASILTLYGTLFTLYTNVPQVKAFCQWVNSALPGWAEMIVGMLIAIVGFYWQTRKLVTVETSTVATTLATTTTVTPVPTVPALPRDTQGRTTQNPN